jgi:hypothetical protein
LPTRQNRLKIAQAADPLIATFRKRSQEWLKFVLATLQPDRTGTFSTSCGAVQVLLPIAVVAFGLTALGIVLRVTANGGFSGELPAR